MQRKYLFVLVSAAIVAALVFFLWSELTSPPNPADEIKSPLGAEQLLKKIKIDYTCLGKKTISAEITTGSSPVVRPSGMPIPDGKAELKLSDGRTLTLPQTLSADGMRYADAGEIIVFWSKGDAAFITESGKQTYSCVIAEDTSATNTLAGTVKQAIYDFPDGTRDCYFFESAVYTGDDLLSRLAQNEFTPGNAQQPINLTPAAVTALKQKIDTTLARSEMKFRAISICHLTPNVDVIGGVIWPLDKSWEEPNYKTQETEYRAYNDALAKAERLIIVSGQNVAVVKDVPMRGPTVTGGDAPSCKAAFAKSNITWTCFMGMQMDKTGQIFETEKFNIWTISLKGEVLNFKEISKKI